MSGGIHTFKCDDRRGSERSDEAGLPAVTAFNFYSHRRRRWLYEPTMHLDIKSVYLNRYTNIFLFITSSNYLFNISF